MAAQQRVIGVIGGSGVYAIDALDNVREERVEGPWGAPSGPLTRGILNGVEVVFLARHGAGHSLTPDAVNYRANIDALKRAGVTDILSVSACGSFREELSPGTFVVIDQYIDRTSGRDRSFFGEGFVAHVSMADPVCPALAAALADACEAEGVPSRRGGVYLCINGPQFSSRAESHLYRSWGADVIGMTNMPEAKLAREAEIPYASIGMVTDYDCWREGEGGVEVAHILEVMRQNTENARKVVARAALLLGPERTPSPLGIETALDFAVITAPGARSPDMTARLDAVAGRFLSAARG